jgi:spore germination protein GerM
MAEENGNKKKITNIIVLAGIIIAMAFVAWLFIYKETGPQVKVYFFQGEKIRPVARNIAKNQTPLEAAIENLLKGPASQETAQEYFTMIPSGTKLVSAKIEGETAIIALTKELGQYGGGASRVRGMLAQIVYTLTELPGVSSVEILVNGARELALGGEGYVLDEKLTREILDF